VMLVTGTGNKVVYRIGRSKERARTPTSGGGLKVADAVIEARSCLASAVWTGAAAWGRIGPLGLLGRLGAELGAAWRRLGILSTVTISSQEFHIKLLRAVF